MPEQQDGILLYEAGSWGGASTGLRSFNW